ncbi:MAG: hypothetical protein KDE27_14060 [Planctomycetes bacterium]|nr:hypothetical protein [Planctomycetota bacterium]
MFRAEDIAALTQRRPFRPFRIHMADGSHVDVRHPELAMIMKDRMIVGLPSDRPGIVDDYEYCAILHITRLEELVDAS